MSRRKRPSLWSGLALSLAAVLVCLLAGEIAVRLRSPSGSNWRFSNAIRDVTRVDAEAPLQLRYDSELGFEPRPGASGNLRGRNLSYSADGFRNQNPAGPRTGPLIVALGDSYTEGYGVGDDETWPAHLERDTGRRVLNAGVRSYGLDQMVLRAERLAPRLTPTTIVLAFIEDDIERTALLAREFRYKPYFEPAGEGLALRGVPVPTARAVDSLDGLRGVLGYSQLLDVVMRRLGATALWYGDTMGTGMDADLISCRLMQRFADLVRRQGAKALVVTFQEADGWFEPSVGERQRRRTTAVLDCARLAGLATLDTYDGLVAAGVARTPHDFFVIGHFNDRGNAAVARLIAAALAAGKQ